MRQQLDNLASPLAGIDGAVGEKPRISGLPASLSFAPAKLLAEFPGPALLVDGHGRVVDANAHAADLAAAITSVSDPRLPALLSEAVASRRPLVEKVRLAKQGAAGGIALELTLVPLIDRDGAHVLVLGRDSTFEQNFTDALLASRQLFRDLVNCSADFAWETGRDGAFSFVSPRGALGYSARELNGLSARSLVHPRHDGIALPFESAEPLDDVETWLRRADGTPACLLTSCVPVLAESGEWLGARGVCRDVTEARERDAQLARARDREALLRRIVESIRNEIEPERVLGAAAKSAALGVGARGCWIFRSGDGARFNLAADFAAGAVSAVAGETVWAALAEITDRRLFEDDAHGHRILAAVSHYRGRANGAICLVRDRDEPPWSDDDRALILGVAAQLGIAIEQIASHERLERLSRTDELTGLLNRRAFFEQVSSRLNHLRRKGRQGALLYLDLDNFKTVNDNLGHQQGDAVLREVAGILTRTSRAGDICGRLGGDEFVLWLEETGQRAAEAKAMALLEACAKVAEHTGAGEAPLGASIGIALSDPGRDETEAQLVARADRAMYDAKHHGKRGFVVLRAEADAEGDEREGELC